MPAWLKFNDRISGGLLNLDFVVTIRCGENKEFGKYFELKFIDGNELTISQQQDKALYQQFAIWMERKPGIFVELESDQAMKMKGEGELE